MKELNLDEISWCDPVQANEQPNEESFTTTSENEEIYHCDVFVSHVDEENLKAELKELESWRIENVYREVPDHNQEAISVSWVVTPKFNDSMKCGQPKLGKSLGDLKKT